MKIVQDLLPINFQRGRKGAYPVDCLVIHVTEGDAASVRSWFHNPSAEVSAHYMNQRDGTIVQFVREEDTAWANGRVDHPTSRLVLDRPGTNPNWWTISIENEGDGKSELTDLQRASLYELIPDIQSRHSRITTDRTHIVGHHEIYSLKPCPGAISVDRIVRDLSSQATVIEAAPTKPRVVWSKYLRDWLIVTKVVSDTEWYYVRYSVIGKMVPAKAVTPLSQMPETV